MNGISLFRHLPTKYQLNPSTVVFSQQPENQSVCLNTGIATFVGVATVVPDTNQTGTFSYRWYQEALDAYAPSVDGEFNGLTLSGTSTNTLTVSGITTDQSFRINYKLQATYNPSGSTPTPYDNPKFSNVTSLTIFSEISIESQPEDTTSPIGEAVTFTVVPTLSNPNNNTGTFSYQWRLNGTNLSNGTTGNYVVSGATTDTLSITCQSITDGSDSVDCIVSHSTACNSPIISNTATFQFVDPSSIERSMLKWEVVRDDQPILLEDGEQNIFNNPLEFSSQEENYRETIVLYAPEKDMEVFFMLDGAAGVGYGGVSSGGAGGRSLFRITLKRNTEYVLKLGPSIEPFGGRGGGGAAAFFYEKGQLLAVVGGGGGAGNGSNGGAGGAIGLAGGTGTSGFGGPLVTPGSLSVTGTSQNGTNGGRVEACTNGDFYQSQGISPCTDVGLVKFRTSDGTIIDDTATIQRGYKAGGNVNRNNGGNSASVIGTQFVGGGGSGATGGQATGQITGSGGGGSGYTNGTVEVFQTQIGTNTTPFAKVRITLPYPVATRSSIRF